MKGFIVLTSLVFELAGGLCFDPLPLVFYVPKKPALAFNPSLSSLLVPTPFNKGRGVARTPPDISKPIASMNLKFYRVLKTSLKVLEM